MPAGRPSQERYRVMRRVTLVGAFTNLCLSLAQVIGGVLAQSQALIADGAHTLSDLLSDVLVVFAARKANAAADARHPYGHGRIETLATVGVGLVLMAVALGIVADAGRRLLSPEELWTPTPVALALAALAIVSKEALYHYTMRTARRVRSSLLEANAWHHRSDVVSSIVVLVGVGATLAGVGFMDAVAAVLVALLIGRMGGVLLADIHVIVAPRISVSEGHRISDTVSAALKRVHEDLSDVLVHIDPEDDQRGAPSSHLPGRAALLARLAPCWERAGVALDDVSMVMHYLDGRVDLELAIPLAGFESLAEAEAMVTRLVQATKEIDEVGEVTVSLVSGQVRTGGG